MRDMWKTDPKGKLQAASGGTPKEKVQQKELNSIIDIHSQPQLVSWGSVAAQERHFQ